MTPPPKPSQVVELSKAWISRYRSVPPPTLLTLMRSSAVKPGVARMRSRRVPSGSGVSRLRSKRSRPWFSPPASFPSHSQTGSVPLLVVGAASWRKVSIPVVIVTEHQERSWLEQALRLRAYSIVNKPLAFEEFVRQVYGIMTRLDRALREN